MKSIRLFSPMLSMAEVLVVLVISVLVTRYFVVQQIYTDSYQIPDVALAPENPVGVVKYQQDYEFTTDWFSPHVTSWEKALREFKGKPNLQYLEVGVFEGRATMWAIENILTDPTSHVTGLDLFEGDYENNYPDFAKRYFANVERSGAKDRVRSIAGFSQVELRKLPLNHYNIIYIDGSHENRDVLEDAILSHRLLKPGGVLIFDDYGRGKPQFLAPRLGINAFFEFYGDQYKLLHAQHQVILKKKTS